MVLWTVTITHPETGQQLLQGQYKSIKDMIPDGRQALWLGGCKYYDINVDIIRALRCESTNASGRFLELRRWFSFDKTYIPRKHPVMGTPVADTGN